MGRPKGLRKNKETGEWYMLEPTVLAEEKPVEEPKFKLQLPAYKRKFIGERFQRNELVSVEQDKGRLMAIVLGYQDDKVVVQVINTQERQLVAESRVLPQSEVK
jgi:hypothetical protein